MEINSVVPDDILEEILLRLPVKHLLPLKCVCKQWYALIGDDCGFHKKHYHFQYALHVAEHDDIPIFLESTPSYDHQELLPTKTYLLSKHQGGDAILDVTPDFERDISAAFANDLKLSNLRLYCFGIVNGVIGLRWGYSSFTEAVFGNPHISYEQDCSRLAVWNPATREFKSIARWPTVPANKANGVFGERILCFGFDLQSNDFKIFVCWVYLPVEENKPTFAECHLYSLKANRWRKIKDSLDSLLCTYRTDRGVYLDNGVHYWVAVNCDSSSNNHRMIISFNFSTETSKEIEMPGCGGVRCRYNQDTMSENERVLCDCPYFEIKVGKYKEGLALFLSSNPYHSDVTVEIWEATKFRDDDCEVPLSWQSVVRVGPIQSYNGLWLRRVRVSGDLLLLIQRGNSEEEELGCLYNPSSCTFNFLEFGFGPMFNYKESLFSLSPKSTK